MLLYIPQPKNVIFPYIASVDSAIRWGIYNLCEKLKGYVEYLTNWDFPGKSTWTSKTNHHVSYSQLYELASTDVLYSTPMNVRLWCTKLRQGHALTSAPWNDWPHVWLAQLDYPPLILIKMHIFVRLVLLHFLLGPTAMTTPHSTPSFCHTRRNGRLICRTA